MSKTYLLYLRHFIALRAWTYRKLRNQARITIDQFGMAYYAGQYSAMLEMWNFIRDEMV